MPKRILAIIRKKSVASIRRVVTICCFYFSSQERIHLLRFRANSGGQTELTRLFRTRLKVDNVNGGVKWGTTSANGILNASESGLARNSNWKRSGYLSLGRNPQPSLHWNYGSLATGCISGKSNWA